MAVLSNTGIRAGASAAGGEYVIKKSLTFNSDDDCYMAWTPSSAGNRKTFTWSLWYKKGESTSWTHVIGADSSSAERQHIRWLDNDQLEIYFISSSAAKLALIPNRKFNDEFGWQHWVLSVDTTQATAANRAKFYVNGQQVTSFSTETYPDQNFDLQINNTIQHIIGKRGYDGNSKLNGKLADVFQIDGQALGPDSFGKFDDKTGVWVPIEYSGTYGTNGYHLDFQDDSTVTALGYDVSGNDNHFTTVNGFHVKATNAPLASASGNGDSGLKNGFSAGGNFSANDANNTGAFYMGDIEFIGLEADSGDTFGFFGGTTDSSTDAMTISKKTNDAGDWASIGTFNAGTINSWTNAVSGALCEGTLSAGFTKNDRIKISGANNFIGLLRITKNGARQGPLIKDHICSATCDSPSNWEPLTGDTCLGGEVSGNYCTWSSFGLTYAFTGNDIKYSNNSVIGTTASSGQGSVCGTMGVTSGKWYCEFWIKDKDWKTANSSTGESVVQVGPTMIDHYPHGTTTYSTSTDRGSYGGDTLPGSQSALAGACGYRMNGNAAIGAWPGSAWTAAGAETYAGGDVIGMALDMDNGAVYFRKNGTWLASGDPTSGASKTGAMHTWTPHAHVPLTPGAYYQNNVEVWLNTGYTPFSNQGPTGYKTWCTHNLPDFSSGGTKNQPNKFFNIVSHTGTGGTSSIDSGLTNPGMALWWNTSTNTRDKHVFDRLRGDGETIRTNTHLATVDTGKQSWESGGMEVVDDGTYYLNVSSDNYRGYFWDVGASAATPSTAGSVNASNSWVNTTTGVELQKVIGTGNNSTIGHNLGAEPTMYWMKKSNDSWRVYHKLYGGDKFATLDLTDAFQDNANLWNDTDASSTVYSVGAASFGNTNTYYNWLFTDVPGFSRFGALRGTGSITGSSWAYCGFRPAFVMVQNASGSTRSHKNWYFTDIKGNPSAAGNYRSSYGSLNKNTPQYTDVDRALDFYANGFQFRTDDVNTNEDNSYYVFAAFAEHPFKIARAA